MQQVLEDTNIFLICNYSYDFHLPLGTTQRQSIGLTFYSVRIKTFAPYFLQVLFSELTLPFLGRAHLTKSLLLSFGRRLED